MIEWNTDLHIGGFYFLKSSESLLKYRSDKVFSCKKKI